MQRRLIAFLQTSQLFPAQPNLFVIVGCPPIVVRRVRALIVCGGANRGRLMRDMLLLLLVVVLLLSFVVLGRGPALKRIVLVGEPDTGGGHGDVAGLRWWRRGLLWWCHAFEGTVAAVVEGRRHGFWLLRCGSV
jgi:hypothetical protein